MIQIVGVHTGYHNSQSKFHYTCNCVSSHKANEQLYGIVALFPGAPYNIYR